MLLASFNSKFQPNYCLFLPVTSLVVLLKSISVNRQSCKIIFKIWYNFWHACNIERMHQSLSMSRASSSIFVWLHFYWETNPAASNKCGKTLYPFNSRSWICFSATLSKNWSFSPHYILFFHCINIKYKWVDRSG